MIITCLSHDSCTTYLLNHVQLVELFLVVVDERLSPWTPSKEVLFPPHVDSRGVYKRSLELCRIVREGGREGGREGRRGGGGKE